jgi:hypothetical protein
MDRDEYLRRAEDCERLAKLLTDQAQQNILRIAAGWRELADANNGRRGSRGIGGYASGANLPDEKVASGGLR